MKHNFPALAMMIAALVLILLGILRADPQQVMAKAIRVCMECVGIG